MEYSQFLHCISKDDSDAGAKGSGSATLHLTGQDVSQLCQRVQVVDLVEWRVICVSPALGGHKTI